MASRHRLVTGIAVGVVGGGLLTAGYLRENKWKETLAFHESEKTRLQTQAAHREREHTQEREVSLRTTEKLYKQLQSTERSLQSTEQSLQNVKTHLSRIQGGVIVPEACEHIVKFGLPSTDNLRFHAGYVTAYDPRNRTALWCCEHLTPRRSEAGQGEVTRNRSVFREDESIPEIFRARLENYAGSGYDRGHLVPASNVKLSQEAMNETFLLSNISPQVGRGFNRHYWARLEKFCRDLLEHYEDVYICTGPLYLPAQEEDGKYYVRYHVIGDPANVSVPTHFYKTVLVMNPRKGPSTHADGSPIMLSSSFILPNRSLKSDIPLQDFIVAPQTLEKASGLQFWTKAKNVRPLCVPGEEKCVLPPPDWWKASVVDDSSIEKDIETFLASDAKSFSFAPSLSSRQRAQVHSTAAKHNLEHFSMGQGTQRHVVIQKKDPPAIPDSVDVVAVEVSKE